jgi:hypothetical protein
MRLSQITQKTAAFTNQREQTAPGAFVVLMGTQMLL